MMNGKHEDSDTATVAAQREYAATKTGAFSKLDAAKKDATAADVAAAVNAPLPKQLFGIQVIDPNGLENVQGLIAQTCDGLKTLLQEKNRKYGNSALQPRRVFSKASPLEQIAVRLDDKLNRIDNMGGLAHADEDTVQDLVGYLVLYMVARRLEKP